MLLVRTTLEREGGPGAPLEVRSRRCASARGRGLRPRICAWSARARALAAFGSLVRAPRAQAGRLAAIGSLVRGPRAPAGRCAAAWPVGCRAGNGIGARGQSVVTESYDIVIEGGTVVDGTGAPGFAGAVAIHGETLRVLRGAAAGPERLGALQATRRIDASGHAVAPGFIDLHSHGGLTILAAEPRKQAASGRRRRYRYRALRPSDFACVQREFRDRLRVGIGMRGALRVARRRLPDRRRPAGARSRLGPSRRPSDLSKRHRSRLRSASRSNWPVNATTARSR